MLGFPLADPIIGLLIAVSILILLWGTVKSIGRRLMDGIDPDILERAEHALEHAPGVIAVQSIKLRWVGHRLQGNATVQVGAMSLADAEHVAHEAQHELGHTLPNLDSFDILTTVGDGAESKPHTLR